MPYIKKESRTNFATGLAALVDNIKDPGDLNYVITKLCIAYANHRANSYSTYNEVIGILECAKLEFYRRVLSLYENNKITLNGDVY